MDSKVSRAIAWESQRGTSPFQALTGVSSAGNITIVTTIWDNLWGDGAKKRAESNFNQLRDTVWKDFINEGSQIVKFHNTQESALSNLNTAFRSDLTEVIEFEFEAQFDSEKQLKSAPSADHLTDELQSRIQNLEMELSTTKMDLQGASERRDDRLISTLVPKLKEVETLLAKFKKELYNNFGVTVTPSSFVDVIDEPSTVDTHVVIPQSFKVLVPLSAPLYDASLHSVVEPGVAEHSAGATSQVQTAPPIHPTTDVSLVEDHALEPVPQKRRLVSHVFRSVKCWGNAVAERHDA